jgi:hypothetical protein
MVFAREVVARADDLINPAVASIHLRLTKMLSHPRDKNRENSARANKVGE